MTAEPDLVALFYQADWTKLSLSAAVHEQSSPSLRRELLTPAGLSFPWTRTDLPANPGRDEHRARLRIAPGGRYLVEILSSSDTGDSPPDHRGTRRTRYGIRAGLPPPYPAVLAPSSLLNAFCLELAGRAEQDGRVLLRVVATPAPGVWRADQHNRPDRIEVTADAQTGILLRYAEFFGGQTVQLTELTDVTFDLAGEFEVPAGAEDDGEQAEAKSQLFPGPRSAAAKAAVNVLGTVFGTLAEHAPGSRRGAAVWDSAVAEDDPEAAMPAPGPRLDPDVSGSPASADLLHALYRSGRAQFSATLHQWTDTAAFGEWMQARASDSGWGAFASAAPSGDRAGTTHRVTRVTLGGGGRYRVDYLRRPRQDASLGVGCDGSRSWREYHDRIVVGPRLPLPGSITAVVDTAMLLVTHVSAVTPAQVGEREGSALRAATEPDLLTMPGSLTGSDLVVDAELGVVLRQASYAGDVLVGYCEFRDLTPLSAGEGNFELDIPPGVPVKHTDSWLFEDLNIPGRMRPVIRTAGSAAKSAHALVRSLRRR